MAGGAVSEIYLTITPARPFHWHVHGSTWQVHKITKEIPGLTWDKRLLCLEGRSDGVAALCARAEALGAHVTYPAEWHIPKEPAVGIGGIELTPLQRAGADWCATQGWDGAILADPMGAGKTRQAIEATRLAGTRLNRIAVVCPAFLRQNWAAEIIARGGINVRTLPFGEEPLEAGWDIMSYEYCAKFNPRGYDGVIFDEAHYVKNHYSAQRSKAALELAKSAKWRLCLTGTPIWNRRKDLWGVAEVARPGSFGSFWHFAKCYLLAKQGEYGMDLDGPYPDDPRYERVTAELSERLKWFLLRREGIRKELLGDLKHQRTIQWIEAGSFPAMDPDTANRASELQSALKLTSMHKTDPAVELAASVAAEGDGYLVFTQTREQARRIAAKLGTIALTGDIDGDDRLRLSKSRPPEGGYVATIDALGVGANCQWASTIIFADLDWVPLKLLQAEGRIERPGQTKIPRFIYLACKGSIDEIIMSTVVGKLEQLGGVLPDEGAGELRDDMSPEATLDSIFEKMRHI